MGRLKQFCIEEEAHAVSSGGDHKSVHVGQTGDSLRFVKTTDGVDNLAFLETDYFHAAISEGGNKQAPMSDVKRHMINAAIDAWKWYRLDELKGR